eukprot:scaffold44069_cov57-Attheya_sp.AAC.3
MASVTIITPACGASKMASRMRGRHWILRQRAAMTTMKQPPRARSLATAAMIPNSHTQIRAFASLPSSTTTLSSPSFDQLEQETRDFLRQKESSLDDKDDYWSSNPKKPSFEIGMKLMNRWRTRQHELFDLEHAHESKEDDLLQMQKGRECAEQMESIMNVAVSVSILGVVRPHVWTMEAWQMVGDGTSAARVLNAWGERYGGDMSLAPTVDDFNLVLRCGSDSPQEAMDMVQLLLDTSVPSLAPNLESYSHVLHTHVHHYIQPPQTNQNHNNNSDSMKEKGEEQKMIQSLFAQIEKLLLREDPAASFQPGGESSKAFLVARSYCDVIRAIRYSRVLNFSDTPIKVDPAVVTDLLDRMQAHLFQEGVVPLWNTTIEDNNGNNDVALSSLFPLTSVPNTKRSVSVSRLVLDAYHHAMLANRHGPPVKTIAEAVEKSQGMESILMLWVGR